MPPQHLVQASDAAGKFVCSVEKRRVAVGDLDGFLEQAYGNPAIFIDDRVALVEQFDRALCPDRPMTQEAADDTTCA